MTYVKTMHQKLKLNKLKLNKGLQMRLNGINQDSVDAYATAMAAGDEFPPIIVFVVDGQNHVVDGFHRVKASEINGVEEIDCEIHHGKYEEALAYATFKANRRNGMRLTRADLQAIVDRVVLDDQYAEWPSRELADLAGVTHMTIQRSRSRLERRPERILKSDGTYFRPRSSDLEFIEGDPPRGATCPRDRFRVLSEKVLDRLMDNIDDVVVSINKLEGDELIEWSSSEKREDLRADIERLNKLLENDQ